MSCDRELTTHINLLYVTVMKYLRHSLIVRKDLFGGFRPKTRWTHCFETVMGALDDKGRLFVAEQIAHLRGQEIGGEGSGMKTGPSDQGFPIKSRCT